MSSLVSGVTSSPELPRDTAGLKDASVLLLRSDAWRSGTPGLWSMEGRLSNEGLGRTASNEGVLPELLIGREKLLNIKPGPRSCCDPLIETSDVMEGDLCTGRIQGENGDCGRDMLLLPENFRFEGCPCDPFADAASSSPLSGGTDRML